jgi:hypothetical protein
MDQAHYAEACPKLQESLRIDPGMGTRFNLAHCWEKLGLTASAWGLFLDVASEAQRTGQQAREIGARERAAALEPKLSRLRVDVPNPVPGLTILISREELGQGAWSAAMPVDPGSYHIEAKAPDKQPWSRDVTVEGTGTTTTVEVPALREVAPAVEMPIPDYAQAGPPEDTNARGSGRIILALSLGTLGVAGVVAGVVYGLDAQSHTNAAQALCTGGADGNVCVRGEGELGFDGGVSERAELEKQRASAHRSATISYVTLGLGAAALVGGAILLLTSELDGEETIATMTLTPVLGPHAAAFELSTQF